MHVYPGQCTCQGAVGDVVLLGAPWSLMVRRRRDKVGRLCAPSCCSLSVNCVFQPWVKYLMLKTGEKKCRHWWVLHCVSCWWAFHTFDERTRPVLPEGANDLCDECKDYSCPESLAVWGKSESLYSQSQTLPRAEKQRCSSVCAWKLFFIFFIHLMVLFLFLFCFVLFPNVALSLEGILEGCFYWT